MLRILLADDHEIVRRATRRLIEERSDWKVCAEAKDGRQALKLAIREQPDIAIIDVNMPVIGGVALTEGLRRDVPHIRVLLFTMHGDDDTVHRAFAAGARGFIVKDDDPRHLMAAIAALGSNRPYFSEGVAAVLLENAVKPRELFSKRFTPRELQVAQLMSEGKSNQGMADALGLSIKTVESHRTAALRKAGVTNGTAFIRFAIKNNLVRT